MCGGTMRLVACIEDPAVIMHILEHLQTKDATREPLPLPESRAPSAGEPFTLNFRWTRANRAFILPIPRINPTESEFKGSQNRGEEWNL
jgi:hypothetical protein